MTERNLKYLRVMADYSSTGLWDDRGYNVDPEDYELSELTLLALQLWCRWYEYNDNCLDLNERQTPLFDLDEFVEAGKAVAQMVKRDLPDFKVVYYNEKIAETSTDRAERYIEIL
jgi:hypothetical protein